MASKGGLNGLALGYVAVGGILIWSGLKGQTITTTIKGFASGKVPQGESPQYAQATAAASNAGSVTESGGAGQQISVTTPGSGTAKMNQNLCRLMAGAYGWSSGPQWTALNNVAMRESGWDANAENPSGAYGIAQALGHAGPGDAGSKSSTAYGGYGVSQATAKAANSGSAAAQIEWFLRYIKETYGTPEGAWNSEQTRGFY